MGRKRDRAGMAERFPARRGSRVDQEGSEEHGARSGRRRLQKLVSLPVNCAAQRDGERLLPCGADDEHLAVFGILSVQIEVSIRQNNMIYLSSAMMFVIDFIVSWGVS
jgi:hypothetical protein